MWAKIKRWFRNLNRDHQDDIDRTVNDDLIPERHPTSYKVWIPNAENIHKTENIKMRTRGEYDKGFPKGLVVHWTSGWMLPKKIFPDPFPRLNQGTSKLKKMARKYALRTAKGGTKNGYNFLIMDVLGNIYQSRPLTKWGFHAGKSYWSSVGHSVSNDFAGIEILNPGKLDRIDGKFYTWFKQEIPKELVRVAQEGDGYVHNGFYCMYTREQEMALKTLCRQLLEMSPHNIFKIDNIVGHDEVAPNRKSDPGGSLSMNMKEFRKSIRLPINS